MITERSVLLEGLNILNIKLSEAQINDLLAFVALIGKWNQTYNLSGIRDSVEMVRLHILDSLAVMPHLPPGRCIDVGTGPGLPGIPLALVLPDTEFVLLDSNAKKTRFVQHALVSLKLTNITVLQTRVERYQPILPFNTVLTRAFSSLADCWRLCQHLLAPEGILLAMKGQPDKTELAALDLPYTLIPLTVPGITAKRCLIRINNTTA